MDAGPQKLRKYLDITNCKESSLAVATDPRLKVKYFQLIDPSYKNELLDTLREEYKQELLSQAPKTPPKKTAESNSSLEESPMAISSINRESMLRISQDQDEVEAFLMTPTVELHPLPYWKVRSYT